MGTKKTYPTEEAIVLKEALEKKMIKVELEYNDGYKHVDLYLPDAKINIEVDGLHHLMDPAQIKRDFTREYYSERSGYHTLHIPNIIIKDQIHLDKIADAIALVVMETKLEKLSKKIK
ncbi:MAG: hypothetical protein WA061_00450 [Microgenomates group bacterium]